MIYEIFLSWLVITKKLGFLLLEIFTKTRFETTLNTPKSIFISKVVVQFTYIKAEAFMGHYGYNVLYNNVASNKRAIALANIVLLNQIPLWRNLYIIAGC